MKTSKSWIGIYAFAVLSFLLWLSGSLLALNELLIPKKSSFLSVVPPQSQTKSIHGGMIVSLGDSLTRGIGDDTGKGYIGIIRDRLQKQSPNSFSLINLSVSGATSTDLRKQIMQADVHSLLKNAQMIPITIGGNDLFRGSGSLEQIDPTAAEIARKNYQDNLQAILSEIRKQNPTAPIFIFGLYNPFGDLEQARETTRLVHQWNETTQQVAANYSHVVMIPTYDLFQLTPNKYLFTDHFHPNKLGYTRMADRLEQVIQDLGGKQS